MRVFGTLQLFVYLLLFVDVYSINFYFNIGLLVSQGLSLLLCHGKIQQNGLSENITAHFKNPTKCDTTNMELDINRTKDACKSIPTMN